jgi:hypothetical protein
MLKNKIKSECYTLGHGQLKDLNRIQSINPREADGQKLRRMWHKHEIERPKRRRERGYNTPLQQIST